MSFQAQPTRAGIYQVKVYQEDNRYWNYRAGWIWQERLESTTNFQWKFDPVQGKSDTFTISPVLDPDVGFIEGDNSVAKRIVGGPSRKWTIKKSADGTYSKIRLEGGNRVLGSGQGRANRVFFEDDSDSRNQRFIFQFVRETQTADNTSTNNNPPPTTNTNNPPPSTNAQNTPTGGKTFEQLWFQLTPEEAAKQHYDIIVVGTGMGAGVIACDLYDTNSRLGSHAKSILVIEKGGLPFHSHCLNASRPSGFNEDRGQQNDTFFALFKENYQFKDPRQIEEWNGGPMYNLGGRGAAWGLFVPRIHEDLSQQELGDTLHRELIEIWYKKAEELMGVFLPTTNTFHQHLMERLNIKTSDYRCQWQWGRIASQFNQSHNFDFATGAYSPIDKLLEIAMSKKRKPDGTCIEHDNWRILINTDVRQIIWDGDRAIGVVVRNANGEETRILLKKDASGKTLRDTKIVLGAGSVGSPAILMRSGKTDFLKRNRGLHLTDHDIFATAFIFRYLDPAIREKVGSMKLQSYVRLKSKDIALVNMAVDSFSFLPRGVLSSKFFTNRDFPKLVVAFIRPAALNKKNTIDLDRNGEPVLTAGREPAFSNRDENVVELRELTKKILKVIKDVLKIELYPSDPFLTNKWNDDKFFQLLPLGGVAHELGTIPLQSFNSVVGGEHLLDENLKLRDHEGLYVCDLSIFPYSPEVNPTLALVALALRLSRRTILPPTPPSVQSVTNAITVINQSGENIKVFVSNCTGAELTDDEKRDNKSGGTVLAPGGSVARQRGVSKNEVVLVYRLLFNSKDAYLPEAVPYLALPGKLCTIE